jgi:uncharacterized glyoxalase superfamily protein PhnB
VAGFVPSGETTEEDTMSNQAPNIFPTLLYEDARAALKWLAEAFGFEQTFATPGPDGTVAHAEIALGPGVIMLGSAPAGSDFARPADWREAPQAVYVAVDDVDAHYEQARAAGAEITRELEDTDYGSREYSARDLEGQHWHFGTYRPSTGAS